VDARRDAQVELAAQRDRAAWGDVSLRPTDLIFGAHVTFASVLNECVRLLPGSS